MGEIRPATHTLGTPSGVGVLWEAVSSDGRCMGQPEGSNRGPIAVSYTTFTLPTERKVEIPVIALTIKHKKQFVL